MTIMEKSVSNYSEFKTIWNNLDAGKKQELDKLFEMYLDKDLWYEMEELTFMDGEKPYFLLDVLDCDMDDLYYVNSDKVNELFDYIYNNHYIIGGFEIKITFTYLDETIYKATHKA